MNKINQLLQNFNSGRFSKFITGIRFIYFKGIKRNASISFKYPITVLVGQNGSGKSSCLQALYGCPKGYNPSKYWFSTKIDPIKTLDDDIKYPTIIYSYIDKTKQILTPAEVLYINNKNKHDDDWETSKPLQKFNMSTDTRYAPVEMEVTYIDFKNIISAYDKCFNFTDPSRFKSPRIQEYIRRQSPQLKNIFNETKDVYKRQGKVQNKNLYKFSDTEIEQMNEILGKNYKSGLYVEHKFYDQWGETVIFKNNNFEYSEAVAGCGEIAVAIMVKKINEASNNSLILLDEPEVSLHPLAQEKLQKYLIKQSLERHIQFVISTHSPSFIKNLPNEAIKVFINTFDGHFDIIENNVSAKTAFQVVGYSTIDRDVIKVEDKLAKMVLEAVICKYKNENPAYDSIKIHYTPGGAKSIYEDVSNLLRFEEATYNKYYFVLDGDQFNSFDDISTWELGRITKENLLQHVANASGFSLDKVKKLFPHNTSDSDEAIIEIIKKYINYANQHVMLLPTITPEELIWDNELCKLKLEQILLEANIAEQKFQEIQNESDFKNKFAILAKAIYGDDIQANTFECLHKEFISRWLNKNDEAILQIKANILDNII